MTEIVITLELISYFIYKSLVRTQSRVNVKGLTFFSLLLCQKTLEQRTPHSQEATVIRAEINVINYSTAPTSVYLKEHQN